MSMLPGRLRSAAGHLSSPQIVAIILMALESA